MKLRTMLKFIQNLADKYLIGKPFVVGGLPRDILLDMPNVKTTDIDLTTNSPDILRLGILLADELNVPLDISDDGHATVFAEEFDLDFSSHFISEKVVEFLDGKHKGLEEAFSRDFTINALHQDLISGEITDPTGRGIDDIKNKLICTPVPARITLTDDPRRVYRAINLAARYGFDIGQEIKDFVISHPSLFGLENVKGKYISIKIGKALKEDEGLTLKLLKEMGLFKNVPLLGYFKDVLIGNKILADYLSDASSSQKVASSISGWDDYSEQGPAYEELSDWWKSNFSKIPGDWNSSYYSWAKWYIDKYRGEWGGRHKGPEEVLEVMEEEAEVSSSSIESSEADVSPSSIESSEVSELNSSNKITTEKPELEGLINRFVQRVSKPSRVDVKSSDVNITNVSQAVKSFINEVGRTAAELGVQTPKITSGWRSTSKQIHLMGKNWSANGGLDGGREYLTRIYGMDYGSSIADIFETYGVGWRGMKYGEEEVKSRSVGSYHILNPAKALDFSVTSGIKEVLDSIESSGRFDMKIVDETNTAGPHYHVTIYGENLRLANINDRKERLKNIGK